MAAVKPAGGEVSDGVGTDQLEGRQPLAEYQDIQTP
jgi:hypothetical protein